MTDEYEKAPDIVIINHIDLTKKCICDKCKEYVKWLEMELNERMDKRKINEKSS